MMAGRPLAQRARGLPGSPAAGGPGAGIPAPGVGSGPRLALAIAVLLLTRGSGRALAAGPSLPPCTTPGTSSQTRLECADDLNRTAKQAGTPEALLAAEQAYKSWISSFPTDRRVRYAWDSVAYLAEQRYWAERVRFDSRGCSDALDSQEEALTRMVESAPFNPRLPTRMDLAVELALGKVGMARVEGGWLSPAPDGRQRSADQVLEEALRHLDRARNGADERTEAWFVTGEVWMYRWYKARYPDTTDRRTARQLQDAAKTAYDHAEEAFTRADSTPGAKEKLSELKAARRGEGEQAYTGPGHALLAQAYKAKAAYEADRSPENLDAAERAFTRARRAGAGTSALYLELAYIKKLKLPHPPAREDLQAVRTAFREALDRGASPGDVLLEIAYLDKALLSLGDGARTEEERAARRSELLRLASELRRARSEGAPKRPIASELAFIASEVAFLQHPPDPEALIVARDAFVEAIEVAGESSDLQVGLGRLAKELAARSPSLDHIDTAEHAFRAALRLGADPAVVWTELGELARMRFERSPSDPAFEEGRLAFDTAEQEIEKKAMPPGEEEEALQGVYLGRAFLIEKQARRNPAPELFEAALGDFDRAYAAGADPTTVWLEVGYLHQLLGRFPQAESYFMRAKRRVGAEQAVRYLSGKDPDWERLEEAGRVQLALDGLGMPAWNGVPALPEGGDYSGESQAVARGYEGLDMYEQCVRDQSRLLREADAPTAESETDAASTADGGSSRDRLFYDLDRLAELLRQDVLTSFRVALEYGHPSSEGMGAPMRDFEAEGIFGRAAGEWLNEAYAQHGPHPEVALVAVRRAGLLGADPQVVALEEGFLQIALGRPAVARRRLRDVIALSVEADADPKVDQYGKQFAWSNAQRALEGIQELGPLLPPSTVEEEVRARIERETSLRWLDIGTSFLQRHRYEEAARAFHMAGGLLLPASDEKGVAADGSPSPLAELSALEEGYAWLLAGGDDRAFAAFRRASAVASRAEGIPADAGIGPSAPVALQRRIADRMRRRAERRDGIVERGLGLEIESGIQAWHRFSQEPPNSNDALPGIVLQKSWNPWDRRDLRTYLYAELSQDLASRTPAELGLPQLAAESATGLGLGIRSGLWEDRIEAFAQVGPSFDLADRSGSVASLDLRMGLRSSVDTSGCAPTFAAPVSVGFQPCLEGRAQLLYMSRWNNDVLGMIEGLAASTVLTTDRVAWQPLITANAYGDTEGAWYNNRLEFGTGIRWRWIGPIKLDLVGGAFGGVHRPAEDLLSTTYIDLRVNLSAALHP